MISDFCRPATVSSDQTPAKFFDPSQSNSAGQDARLYVRQDAGRYENPIAFDLLLPAIA
jgi:hypothetical protein